MLGIARRGGYTCARRVCPRRYCQPDFTRGEFLLNVVLNNVNLGPPKQWFEEVATATPAYDGTLDFYLYDQQRSYDIKVC
jgi:hypothetical protein